VDAKEGKLWLKDPLGEVQPGTESTQRRKIERAGLVLGLSAKVSSTQAEGIRGILDFSGLEHEKARRDYGMARGRRQRGEAVESILRQLQMTDGFWARLLEAGYVSGLWGQPWVWEARTNRRLSAHSAIGLLSRPPP
jgi:hypothetical protein